MFRGRLASFKTSYYQIKKSLSFAYNVDKKAFLAKGFSKIIQFPFPIIQAYLAKLIMDQISIGIKTGQSDTSLIYKYLAIELGLLIFQSIITTWQSKSDYVYKEKMQVEYEKIIFDKVTKISYQALEQSSIQDKMYEVQSRSYSIESMLNNFFGIIQGLSLLISFLGVLLTINPWIALIVFAVTFVTFLSNKRFSKQRIESFKKLRTLNRLKNHLSFFLTSPYNSKEVKSLNVESKLLGRYQDIAKKLFNEGLSIRNKESLYDMILKNVSTLTYYGSYAWVVWLTVHNKISLGDLTMFVILFSKTESGLTQIFDAFVSFVEENDKIKTFFNFLSVKESNVVDLSEDAFNQVLNNPTVEFKNVSFGYDEKSLILKNVSFTLHPKSKVALVGENGAGKSTIIKLLCGLYTPTSGDILIGGINIKNLSRKQIKSLMGVVFQDFIRFPTSFKENITLAEELSTDESYSSALTISGAQKVKETLQEGDNQLLNKHLFENGMDLSGGQWQKIALARAFIQNGKILILDEPTSAIDAKQEYEIFMRFQELTKNRTSILVSHRFSTVRIAERIIFLENGEVIEDGSHAELIALNGKYAHMFNLQAEGYR